MAYLQAVVTALPGAPANVLKAIEEAHAQLHKTRCQRWMAATGHRANPYQILATGDGPVRVYKRDRPRPWLGCELHPVEDGDL